MTLHHLPRMPIKIPFLQVEVLVVGVVAGVWDAAGRGTRLTRFTTNNVVVGVGVVVGSGVVVVCGGGVGGSACGGIGHGGRGGGGGGWCSHKRPLS